MKPSSLSSLQSELRTLPPARLLEITTRLIKYKKENKELLTYLLFEAQDEEAYIKNIKQEMDIQFDDINSSNLYLAKKSFRKILRIINKFIRYSGKKDTEIELRIYYCSKMENSGIRFRNNKVLQNLFNNQIKKIESIISGLHEDLQFDFRKELKKLYQSQ